MMTKPIKYKETGLEWCPQIPEHWEIKKLKYCLKYETGFTPPTGQSEYYGDNNIWITISDINNKYVSKSKQSVTHLALEKFNPKPVYKGALLYTFKLSVGKVAFSDVDICYTNEAIFFINPAPNVNLKYYYYSLPLFIIKNANENIYGAKILNQDAINNAILLSITQNEQQKIADYLNRKTSLIDSIISKKEKQIELYKEERIAVINRAVTKGLNPHVEMKDSGIEWLGSIPKHWEVKKISQGFETIGSGTTPSAGNALYYENGTYDWLQTGDLTDNYVTKTSRKITQEALNDYPTLRFYKKGSLVIAMYGATIGKVGILNIETTTNQACCILSDSSTWIIRYVYYWFIANKRHIVALSYGGGQPNISQQTIRNLKIPYLSTKEQELIVTYLDNETNRIDTLVYKTSKQIELLKEYKEALINEVVTGQRIID